MSFQPYLISNYATGFDRERQPWLLPDDAFVDLFDGYVFEGVLNKRDGYSGFANGELSTYCESRMVHRITDEATGQNNGGGVLANINLANSPVRRGTVTVTAGATSITDNGTGGFTGALAGSINYTTGVISGFQFPVGGGDPVTVTYDYHPGNPVMGIMNFYTSTNVRELIVADTEYVNRYNTLTARLDDISPASPYTGTPKDFWSWVNYPDATNNNRLLFANGLGGDVIQSYDGSTVSDYVYTMNTDGGAPVTSLNCRQLFEFKDRLILFQTNENGVIYPRRIRISGFGANCDDFLTSAPGAGVIDIPDNSWFYGAAFNRDDLVIFTEQATWMLKYTGNDVTPFALNRIDESRGSKAAFSAITYLNRTMAASPRGLIISDGYRVERMDNDIHDYTQDDIDAKNFDLCFAGFIDQERDVYLIHPQPNESQSSRILVSNFQEDNFAVYRLPLSCMGNFINTFDVTWNMLTNFSTWDELSNVYGNWNSFSYTEGAPIGIGGGHAGEIYRLNVTEIEDNPQKVRGITIVDATTLRVETDWNNYQIGDYISFTSVGGMTQINSKQAAIKAINTANRIFDLEIDTTGLSAYTSGGTASRVIPFEALTKKFNPFSESDKKVCCGWIYFYVSTSGTDLTDSDGNEEPCLLEIDVITNDNEMSTTPAFTYQVNCSNTSSEIGTKKWYKLWINQTARFIQLRLRNTQAGAKIAIQAMMPGFKPVGRLIP